MAQRGEEKREIPATRRGGRTAARVESAPPSFVGKQARHGGQMCDHGSIYTSLKKQQPGSCMRLAHRLEFADVGKQLGPETGSQGRDGEDLEAQPGPDCAQHGQQGPVEPSWPSELDTRGAKAKPASW